MKIIRPGREQAAPVRRFTCLSCGCVFEAGPKEYQAASSIETQHDGIESSCKCPCCGRRVYRYHEERPELSTGQHCPKCGAWMLGRGSGHCMNGALYIDHGEQFCPRCGYVTVEREAGA